MRRSQDVASCRIHDISCTRAAKHSLLMLSLLLIAPCCLSRGT